MKLLVTGGLGFIGSNFIVKTIQNNSDASIVNVDAELYGSNPNSLTEIRDSENYSFIKGNINDQKLMDKLVSSCDIVINFAAESFVDRSISDARPFLDSNVNGVFTILEQIKKHKKRLIHVSTDEVYGSLEQGSAKEDYRFNPSSPYAASKAAAELLINSYFITYGLDCLITRCTNNYGPKQFPEKLIPKTILLAHKNEKIPVYGTGKNIRDWIFVEDHCDAITKVVLEGKPGESYNVSAKNEIDNLTIINKILSLMGKSSDLIQFVEDRPGHDLRYSLDSSKIRDKLGWREKTNFEDGITKTVNWYLSHNEWWRNISTDALNPTPWKI